MLQELKDKSAFGEMNTGANSYEFNSDPNANPGGESSSDTLPLEVTAPGAQTALVLGPNRNEFD